MENQTLEPIKEGEFLKKPLTDYLIFVNKIGKSSLNSVKLFESKIETKNIMLKISDF